MRQKLAWILWLSTVIPRLAVARGSSVEIWWRRTDYIQNGASYHLTSSVSVRKTASLLAGHALKVSGAHAEAPTATASVAASATAPAHIYY